MLCAVTSANKTETALLLMDRFVSVCVWVFFQLSIVVIHITFFPQSPFMTEPPSIFVPAWNASRCQPLTVPPCLSSSYLYASDCGLNSFGSWLFTLLYFILTASWTLVMRWSSNNKPSSNVGKAYWITWSLLEVHQMHFKSRQGFADSRWAWVWMWCTWFFLGGCAHLCNQVVYYYLSKKRSAFFCCFF